MAIETLFDLDALVDVPPQGGYVAKQCARRAYNDHSGEYPDEVRDEDPPGLRERMAEGVRFEAEIGECFAALLAPVGYDPAFDELIVLDRAGRLRDRDAVLATIAATLAGAAAVAVPVCDRTERSKRRREVFTLAAMDAHVPFIWNARLPSTRLRSAEPDFLIRHEDVWLVGDVKAHKALSSGTRPHATVTSPLADPRFDPSRVEALTGRLKRDDALQLAHYVRTLEELGFAVGTHAAIVGVERKLIWGDLAAENWIGATDSGRHYQSALALYDEAFAQRVLVIDAARRRRDGENVTAPVQPEHKAECKSCPWRTVCHDELVALGHVTLLPGITPERARAHYALGHTRIRDLARLDTATAQVVDAEVDAPALIAAARAVDPATPVRDFAPDAAAALTELGLTTADAVARLDPTTAGYSRTRPYQLTRAIDQARVHLAQRVHRARGREYVDLPDPTIALHVDVENDGDFVYLIGVHAVGRKRADHEARTRTETHAFVTWDGTAQGEAQVFAEFWDYLNFMRDKAKHGRWSLRVFHYYDHERRVFRALADRHAKVPGVPSRSEVDAVLDSGLFIDLHKVLTSQLVWPTEDVTLKTLAKYVRFVWRDENPNGGDSVAWYRTMRNETDPDARTELQTRILEYNEDDCRATAALCEFLYRLGETRRPGRRLTPVEDLEKRFTRRRRAPAVPSA